MANVRTLGTTDRNNNNNQYPGYGGQPLPSDRQQARTDEQQRLIFGDGGAGDSPYPPLNKVLAPDFNRYTFIFWISIIQICVFIAELIVGQIKFNGAFVATNDMAGPSTECLRYMGAKYLPDIQKGEVYRFITPAFLHAGVLHIFTNLVSQTMIAYTMEMLWGFWKIAIFYFATTFGASLLSCVGSSCSSVSVGASGALLGLIGCHMAWLLLNWNNEDLTRQPCSTMCVMIWWLFIIFLIGISVSGIDNFAHLGGWVSGLFIGFGFGDISRPVSWIAGRENIWKMTGIILTFCYFTSTLLSTFLAINC